MSGLAEDAADRADGAGQGGMEAQGRGPRRVPQSRRVPDGPHPLLERDDVLAAAGAGLDAARSGRGSTLLVMGEAGLGKSSVLGQLIDHAHGFAIGSAVGVASEARLPFGLIGLALASLGGDAAFTAEINAEAGEARAARFYRSLRWLTEAAEQGPVLVVLDDLHWADPDTLDLVAFLGRRVQDLPVLLVGACRRWPAGAAQVAADLHRSGNATLYELAPLSADAGRQLLERHLGQQMDDARAGEIWEACGGNPLLLGVAAASIGDGEELPGPIFTKGLPGKLLLARFAGVGEAALLYARAAAVFGTEFRPELAGALAGLDDPGAAAALADLCETGLVIDAPAPPGAGPTARARFVHPLFAQALMDDLPGPVCARMHRAAFKLLTDAGIDAVAAARHAVAADMVGDPAAVALLERLGRGAFQQGATATAAQHLESAVALAGSRATVGLRLVRAQALVVTGRVAEAEEACRDVVRSGEATGVALADALRHLAWTAHLQGALEEGMEHLDQAVAACIRAASDEVPAGAPADTVDTIVQILLDCAHTAYLLVGPERARPIAGHAAAVVVARGGSPGPEITEYQAFLDLLLGSPSGGRATAHPAPAAATDLDVESLGGWGPLFGRLNRAKLTERYDEAVAAFAEANEAAEHMGSPVGIVSFAVAHADTLFRQGDLRGALAQLDRADLWAEFTPVVTPWTMAVRAAVLVELGRSADAAACCDTLDTLEPSFGGHLPLIWLWQWMARCRLVLDAGRADRASDLADRIAGAARMHGFVEPCTVPWAAVALDAHVAAGRNDRIAGLVAQLERATEELPCAWPRAMMARGRAALAESTGDIEHAFGCAQQAVELAGSAGMPLAEAELMVALGATMRRAGRPADSRRPLAGAAEVADACGAERISTLARRELAASGGRRRRRGASATELTGQERRVADLAATGLTNREIAATLYVSAKTVDHHLGRVYQKLGISSRRELIRSWPPAAGGTDDG